MPGADHNRVVITGVGLLTALGTTREVSWDALKQGKCGARRLEGIETGLGDDYFGAPAALLDRDSRTEPVVQIALATAREAVADSRIELETVDRGRIGCFVGTSKNGWQSICRALNRFHRNREVDAELWQSFLPYWPTSIIAREFDLQGPLSCLAAACSTGAIAVLKGAESIRDGFCDVALCGCADASLEPMVLASYRQLGVLARGFDDPARACRPYDARRNGFLIGEGGMTCVMESLLHARKRGAPIYAELLAGASWADGRHFIHLDSDSDVLVRLIETLLRHAKRAPDELDYIHLHGTATKQNDLFETITLKKALGSAAYRVSLSSTKPMTGHTLGASGGVELAITLLALRDGVIPPTLNLETPDPECDLDYAPICARQRRVETAMKISLGFGGHLTALLLSRPNNARHPSQADELLHC